MKNKKLTAVFILLTYFFSTLPPAAYTQDVSPDRTPEPYGVDEFDTWQKDLRRFEIISFGALPFVTFLSFWTYDIIRSVQHKGDSAYAPWPIKNPETAVPLSEGEQKKIFFTSIGISIGIAIIDISVRSIKRSRERRKKKALEESGISPIELIPIEDGEDTSSSKKNEEKTKKSADEEGARIN